jgi:hypothetical protein
MAAIVLGIILTVTMIADNGVVFVQTYQAIQAAHKASKDKVKHQKKIKQYTRGH